MRIKQGLPSRRSPVYEFQARYLGVVIRNLESAFLRRFRPGQEISDEAFAVFKEMPEYSSFDEAALLCGFVCSDFNKVSSFKYVHSSPKEVVPRMTFDQIRLYIHSLQRATKWTAEYNEALWGAVSSGALGLVAERIESDPSLFQTIAN